VADRIRTRLEALERTETPSPEAEEALLAERARALARGGEAAPEVAARVVRFALEERALAIDAVFVHAILRAPRVTPLPGSPPLEGLLPWRGGVLPVVSLSALLGTGRMEERGPLLLVGREAPELACRVSAVDALAEPLVGELRGAPVEAGGLTPLLQGSLVDGALHLSGEALLQDPRLFF
jgi:purine-binding chemotaxis protein CheW